MSLLKGKTALVFGVANQRSIAWGITQAFQEQGATIGLSYAGEVLERRVKPLAESINCTFVEQCDVSEDEDIERVTQRAVDSFGEIDILVHAASPFVRASLAETTLEAWRLEMGVIAESFLLLTQALAAGMVERGKGAIVAILDQGVFDPWPAYLAHGAAKSALWALARSLAVELAPQVRVNGVVPGPVLPPPGLPQAVKDRLAAETLLGRWGEPQDVVDAVLYLICADYVTGEVLFVDGGDRWG